MTSRRRLRRFFSNDPLPATGQRVFLSEDETRHLRKILRLKSGDECLVRDAGGQEARAVIVGYPAAGGTEIQIQELMSQALDSKLSIKVFAAVPQHGKMDFLVEKAQELGVAELTPLQTARTVLKMQGAGRERAVERWRRISREALKQSGSSVVMKVREPLTLKEALAAVPPRETLAFFHPSSDAVEFSNWIQEWESNMPLNIFFGPEGGFSPEEVKAAAAKGAAIISLGQNVLKTDTAFVGVIAALRFML